MAKHFLHDDRQSSVDHVVAEVAHQVRGDARDVALWASDPELGVDAALAKRCHERVVVVAVVRELDRGRLNDQHWRHSAMLRLVPGVDVDDTVAQMLATSEESLPKAVVKALAEQPVERLMPRLLQTDASRGFDVVNIIARGLRPGPASEVWRLAAREVGDGLAEPFLVQALDAAERACVDADADVDTGWRLADAAASLARRQSAAGHHDAARALISRGRVLLRHASWRAPEAFLVWESLEAAGAHGQLTLLARWANELLLLVHDMALTEHQVELVQSSAQAIYYGRHDDDLVWRLAQRGGPATRDLAGFALMRLGRHDDAVDSFRLAVQSDPDSTRGHFNLAAALAEAGRASEARGILDELAALDETYWRGWALRALLAARDGDGRAAVAALEQAVGLLGTEEQTPEIVTHLALVARAAVAAGADAARVVSVLDRVGRDGISRANRLFTQAEVLIDRGCRDDAIGRLREALEHAPDHAPARLALVDLLMAHEQFRAAAATVQPLTARSADPEAAAERLDVIVGHDPRPEHRRLLALAHAEGMRHASAVHQLTGLLEECPNDAEALRLRGLAQLSTSARQSEDAWNKSASLARYWDGLHDLARAVELGDAEALAPYRWALDRCRLNAAMRDRLFRDPDAPGGMHTLLPGLRGGDEHLAQATASMRRRDWARATDEVHAAQAAYEAIGLSAEAASMDMLLADLSLRQAQPQRAWDLLGNGSRLLAAIAAPLATAEARMAHELHVRSEATGNTRVGLELDVADFTLAMLVGPHAYERLLRVQTLAMLGRTRETEQELADPDELLDLLAQPSVLVNVAEAARAIMAILRDIGRPREAIALSDRAIAIADNDQRRVAIHVVAAVCYARLGEDASALREVAHARELSGPEAPDVTFALDITEAQALLERDPQRALRLLCGLVARLPEVDAGRRAAVLTVHAEALHALGREGEADEAALDAERVALMLGKGLFDAADRAEANQLWVRARALRCELAIEADDPPRALRLISEMKARVLAVDQERALQLPPHDPSPVLAAIAARREALLRLLDFAAGGEGEVDWEALRGIPDGDSSLLRQDGVAVRLDAARVAAAIGRADTQLNDLRRRPGRHVEAVGAPLPSAGRDQFADIDPALPARAELLLLGDAVALAGADAAGVPWLERVPVDTARLRELADGIGGPAASEFLRTPELWENDDVRRLVAAVRRNTDAGVPLVLVGHDALHQIPLHAIDDSRGVLADDRPISYAPSAAVLRQCARTPRRQARQAIVVADSRDDLDHARLEGRSVARAYGVEPILGVRADRSRLLGLLSEDAPDVLHIACHGTFVPEDADASRIEMAGGLGLADELAAVKDLTARDVAELYLPGTLVVLSACHSGASRIAIGEEPFGLARAFLTAGARAVIATRWAVSDVSTWLLMERFTELLTGSPAASPAEALRSAQLHVRDLSVDDLIDACTVALRDPAALGSRAVALLHQRRAEALARIGEEVRAGQDATVAARLRGYRDEKPLSPSPTALAPGGEWRPFADPWFWAGTSLFGDGA